MQTIKKLQLKKRICLDTDAKTDRFKNKFY